VPAIGILGGSFNPPHLGHLHLARHARDELGLERVVLMPLHASAHKAAERDPGPVHRLAMCRLAAAEEPGVSACALEIERGGVSYTADTLKEIHARHPEADLTFIVGADTARTLPAWHEPRTVLELARLAVASRPGSEREQVLSALEEVLGGERATRDPTGSRVVFLSMPPIEASSSQARARLAAGQSAEDLLGKPVSDYISKHGLYAAEREPAR
jgi:nicotinate-nucleotide adenylyltransferase